MQTINKLDRHILRILQGDSRATFDQIGDAIGLSPRAVLRRVKRREMDYLLPVAVPDMGAYSHFLMDTLLKHPSVQDCKTSFVLDQVKATTALPV